MNETEIKLKRDLYLLRWFEIACVGTLGLFEFMQLCGLKDVDEVVAVGSVIIFGGIMLGLNESMKLLNKLNSNKNIKLLVEV